MRARVALALGIVYLVWGSTYLAIRIAVAELPPFLIGGVRLTIAGLVFLAVGLLTGGRLPNGRELRHGALVGALLLGVSNGLVALAARTVPSGLIALLIATTPLWVAGFESLGPRGHRPPRRALAGLFVGFAGTAFLVWGTTKGSTIAVPLGGMLLALTAAALWAGGSIFARSGVRPQSFAVGAGIEMLTGGLVQTGIAAVSGDLSNLASLHPSGRALLAILYLIVFGSWIGYGAFSWLLRNVRLSLVATYAYVNPLVAVALGAAIASEPLSARVLIAGAVIVSSVVLVTTART